MTEEERDLAVVVHNNYIAGYDEKLDRFKKWGLWALDDGRVTQKTKKNSVNNAKLVYVLARHVYIFNC